MNSLGKQFLVLTLLVIIGSILVAPVSAATTQVQIVKYASDGTTILSDRTLTWQQMRDTLPVLGDGVTHYYHQGPVFVDDPDETVEQALRWNPEESINVDTKDMGAVKGTNLKDLCNLVGGMSPGEELKILASDGWYKWFAYKNVYQYSSREGPIGITWYKNGLYPDSGYTDGMRMVWFADDSVNKLGPGGTGLHAFGNWDWHEAADPQYWYYYISGGEYYPTTTGLSGQVVNRIYIYSDDAPLIQVPQIPGYQAPTDPNGDGLYEDLNGNGRNDFNDVVVFFNNMEWIGVQDGFGYFDFNGNGRIDFNDVIRLFEGM
jgi:PKD repeat protein